MFILKLYDRKGRELNTGDIVKISNGKYFTFWAEVKYLQKEKVITPFHTFSFHSFEKVDKVPENATKSTEDRYNIWYVYQDEAEEDKEANKFEQYLMDWRICEHLLDDKCFRIALIEGKNVGTGFPPGGPNDEAAMIAAHG
jgi:hypothetical protein